MQAVLLTQAVDRLLAVPSEPGGVVRRVGPAWDRAAGRVDLLDLPGRGLVPARQAAPQLLLAAAPVSTLGALSG